MKKYLQLIPRMILVLLIIHPISVLSRESSNNLVNIDDGPYVFLDKNKLITHSLNVCKQTKIESINNNKNSLVGIKDCKENKISITNPYFASMTDIEFKTDAKIAAISDFHGQYSLMKTILANNKVIDTNGYWSFGKGHLVITGDVFDRGDKVTEILWFLFELEKQAKAHGGMVHLLLGNHEVMVLNNDLRYLHPKYKAVEEILSIPTNKLYDENTVLGSWLRSKNVLVKINNVLFAHGGFHPDLVDKGLDLTTLNETFKESLIKPELPLERTGLAKYLHKTNGLIWYRGYFNAPTATEAEIDKLLKFYKVSHIAVGHTSQTEIKSRYQGRVLAIDSSIKKGEYGEVLFVEEGKPYKGNMHGEKLPITELVEVIEIKTQ